MGKYGTRYGASLRKMVKKIEITQHGKYVCYFCGKVSVLSKGLVPKSTRVFLKLKSVTTLEFVRLRVSGEVLELMWLNGPMIFASFENISRWLQFVVTLDAVYSN